MMSFKQLLTHRGMAAFLGATIGPLSLWLLLLNGQRVYYEYYLYPRIKAADLYYYPSWRYTMFDAVLLPWCIVGLATSVLLFRAVILNKRIDGCAARTTTLYFAGLAVLVAGVVFGTYLRSLGV